MASEPVLSIIVPTFNRCSLLRDVLADLDRQQPFEGAFEVIVVDDGSTDGTSSLLDSTRPEAYELRKIAQTNQGLNAARNAGAGAAKAELLAFLDDDVVVSPGYAAAMWRTFVAYPEAVAIAGQITLKFDRPPPRWLTPGLEEFLSKFDVAVGDPYLPQCMFPRGANFGVRRSAWSAVGGFAAGLDRQGASLVSNGEIEFFHRLYDGGARVVASSEASVLHRVPPERLTVQWFRRRASDQGRSDILIERPERARPRLLRLGREAVRATRALPILGRNIIAGRAPVSALTWLSYCTGRMSAIRSSP